MKPKSALFAILFLVIIAPGIMAAQPFGSPLTSEQVACEERQMGRLLHRMGVSYGEAGLYLWRSAANGGSYRGLASTDHLYFDPTTTVDIRMRDEKQLAFDLILRADEDFLNPRRERRPQATLVRRDAASNLDPMGTTRFSMLVDLILSPEPPDPFHPKNSIRITTLQEAPEDHADTAGRGLTVDDLLNTCHTEVTDFDLKVYSILARTVRPTGCLAEPIPNPVCGFISFKTAFYRAEEPLTYRADVYLSSLSCDEDGVCVYSDEQNSLLFRIQADAQGRLASGEVSLLPFCTASGQTGCSPEDSPWMGLYVLPPLRPGIEVQGEEVFRRAAHLNLFSVAFPDLNILRADVNWADLLKDTSWNGGLQP
ncbi:MAG: hypothetical protein ABJC13_14660 [Acidobacteriota bacterium]